MLYKSEHCGQSKALVAKQQLLALNENIQVDTYCEPLNVNNAFNIIPQYQIIIDGSDNYATRYLANDVCQIKKITLISASLLQFDGQLLTFYHAEKDVACYRCLYPNPPPAGLILNCADAGIIGSIAGILGTMAATQAIKIALGINQNDKNKLFVFDGVTFELHKYNFTKRADCILCSSNIAFEQLPRYETNFCSSTQIKQISVKQLADYQTKNNNILLVDVRTHHERNLGYIPNSIHIPLDEIPNIDKNLFNKDMVILYCKSGVRSAHAAMILQEKGLKNVFNLAGGIVEWNNSQH